MQAWVSASLFSMGLTSVIEHTPREWIITLMESNFQANGIVFFFFVHILQIIFRLFGGAIAQRISPPGLLCTASILSVISLCLFGMTHTETWAYLAAGLFGISIAWYWPTFIAIVVDRYPLSGSVGMGLMNSAGFIPIISLTPVTSQLSAVEGVSAAFLSLAWYGFFSFILLAAVSIFFQSQGGYKVLSSNRSI